MKKVIALILAIVTLFSVSISASASTFIAPGTKYPSTSDTSNSCTVKLTSGSQASVNVWAYGGTKNAKVNIRMLDGSTKKVIWSENSSFTCSKVYMYSFYQGGRTYYLGADHKSYKLQFTSSQTLALYVKNPSKCTIS